MMTLLWWWSSYDSLRHATRSLRYATGDMCHQLSLSNGIGLPSLGTAPNAGVAAPYGHSMGGTGTYLYDTRGAGLYSDK